MTSGLILLQLFILAKEMEGRSLQGTVFAANSDHIFLQPRLEQSSVCGVWYEWGGKCPRKRGQHESSLARSGDNTLNPVELFTLQDSAQSEKNTAALSKEMVTGCATVPS